MSEHQKVQKVDRFVLPSVSIFISIELSPSYCMARSTRNYNWSPIPQKHQISSQPLSSINPHHCHHPSLLSSSCYSWVSWKLAVFPIFLIGLLLWTMRMMMKVNRHPTGTQGQSCYLRARQRGWIQCWLFWRSIQSSLHPSPFFSRPQGYSIPMIPMMNNQFPPPSYHSQWRNFRYLQQRTIHKHDKIYTIHTQNHFQFTLYLENGDTILLKNRPDSTLDYDQLVSYT